MIKEHYVHVLDTITVLVFLISMVIGVSLGAENSVAIISSGSAMTVSAWYILWCIGHRDGMWESYQVYSKLKIYRKD